MSPFVSVIVPVYKVPEKYLRQCIGSIRNQTLKEIEIILVDDGSPDDCGKICDEYAEKDPRIKVIHQENRGVSFSRNVGIDCSSRDSEYISFIDADDYVDERYLEVLYKKIRENDSDAVQCNHSYVTEDGKLTKRERIPDRLIDLAIEKKFLYNMITPEFSRRYENCYYGAIRGVWGKILRKRIITENNLKFNEEMKIGEDAIFVLSFLKCAHYIETFNDYLYVYRVYSMSANRQYRSDIMEQRDRLLLQYLQCFKEDTSIEFRTCYIREVLSAVINILKKDVCRKEKKNRNGEKRLQVKNFITKEEVSGFLNSRYDRSFFDFKEKILLRSIEKGKIRFLLFVGAWLK